jgi:hypothetical protein
MGKLEVGKNLLSRAKGVWGWFIKKSPAFIVLTSLTVVSVFGLGVGGTLAATGVIPNPFASQGPENNEALNSLSGEPGNEGEWSDPYPWSYGSSDRPPSETKHDGNNFVTSEGTWVEGSSWKSFGAPDLIRYRWSTTDLHVISSVSGPCPSKGVGIRIMHNMPNYGYLSEVSARNFGWSGSNAVSGADHSIGGFKGGGYGFGPDGCNWYYHHSFGNYKCFNFNEVWIEMVGPIEIAVPGLHKIPIPEVVAKKDCWPGSELNDPTKYLGEFGSDVYEKLRDYPEAVVTPPGYNRPPKIEWGPYVPSTATSPSSRPTSTPSTPNASSPELQASDAWISWTGIESSEEG